MERRALMEKRRSTSTTSILSLNPDILATIFSNLDQFDLVRCTSVCKSWHYAVHRSDVLKMKFCEDGTSLFSEASSSSRVPLKNYMQEWAMKEHKLSLQSTSVHVDQWVGHSLRVHQCRLKMGSILTGVGDKVVRIWSLQSYKCLEEYSILNVASLADFDFDENKIVGLLGTRICIWRRHGKRVLFPSNEGTFSRGLCMRYIDPEAVVGCEDGSARIFDMYSKRCSQIIRMHTGPLTCLAVTDDQLILCGCSLGSIKVASVSSNRNVDSLTPFRFTVVSEQSISGEEMESAQMEQLRSDLRTLFRDFTKGIDELFLQQNHEIASTGTSRQHIGESSDRKKPRSARSGGL